MEKRSVFLFLMAFSLIGLGQDVSLSMTTSPNPVLWGGDQEIIVCIDYEDLSEKIPIRLSVVNIVGKIVVAESQVFPDQSCQISEKITLPQGTYRGF